MAGFLLSKGAIIQKGSACHELHSQIFYILPQKSAQDKTYGPYPAAVIKTKEQQKSGKALFQAYQVIIAPGQGHHDISIELFPSFTCRPLSLARQAIYPLPPGNPSPSGKVIGVLS